LSYGDAQGRFTSRKDRNFGNLPSQKAEVDVRIDVQDWKVPPKEEVREESVKPFVKHQRITSPTREDRRGGAATDHGLCRRQERGEVDSIAVRLANKTRFLSNHRGEVSSVPDNHRTQAVPGLRIGWRLPRASGKKARAKVRAGPAESLSGNFMWDCIVFAA
jgi:hypothetical protein